MPGHLARRLFGRRQRSRHRASAAPSSAVAERLESRVLMAVAPVINEFLASNDDTNKDEDGDKSDWIEIYNPNPTAISLNGYFLTDKASELTQWKFPDVSIAGDGYLLV